MTYGVFVWGVWSDTAGDKTEFNRILCTSKSEAAVTSNKKLRCRYEASRGLFATAELLVDQRIMYRYILETIEGTQLQWKTNSRGQLSNGDIAHDT